MSGAARGVDVTAIRGAFEAGGVVVGIPADGLEHRLRDASIRMAVTEGQAVLVSPYRPDAPFSVGSAMGRNKLIYAMSTVAVVVSSSSGSGGTWAGAIEALKFRWVPVYVRDSTGVRNGNAELIARGGRALAGIGALDHIDLADEASRWPLFPSRRSRPCSIRPFRRRSSKRQSLAADHQLHIAALALRPDVRTLPRAGAHDPVASTGHDGAARPASPRQSGRR